MIQAAHRTGKAAVRPALAAGQVSVFAAAAFTAAAFAAAVRQIQPPDAKCALGSRRSWLKALLAQGALGSRRSWLFARRLWTAAAEATAAGGKRRLCTTQACN